MQRNKPVNAAVISGTWPMSDNKVVQLYRANKLTHETPLWWFHDMADETLQQLQMMTPTEPGVWKWGGV